MNVDTQVGKVAGYSLPGRSSIPSMSTILLLRYFVQSVGLYLASCSMDTGGCCLVSQRGCEINHCFIWCQGCTPPTPPIYFADGIEVQFKKRLCVCVCIYIYIYIYIDENKTM